MAEKTATVPEGTEETTKTSQGTEETTNVQGTKDTAKVPEGTEETAKAPKEGTEEKTEETVPKRRVIVAMDGSDHSDYALEWYLGHVHRDNDYVILAYVPELNDILHSSKWTNSAVYQFNKEEMQRMLHEEQQRIKKELDVFADKLRHHGLGGKVKSVMASKPGEGIIKAAEDEEAKLIVVGSRGLGQLRRTFLGSVSDYVIHHAHVPVFVCKHPAKHIPGHEHPKKDKKEHSKGDESKDKKEHSKGDDHSKEHSKGDHSKEKKAESKDDHKEPQEEKDSKQES